MNNTEIIQFHNNILFSFTFFCNGFLLMEGNIFMREQTIVSSHMTRGQMKNKWIFTNGIIFGWSWNINDARYFVLFIEQLIWCCDFNGEWVASSFLNTCCVESILKKFRRWPFETMVRSRHGQDTIKTRSTYDHQNIYEWTESTLSD